MALPPVAMASYRENSEPTLRDKQRLKEMLAEQRHLLRKSIDDVVAGDLAEALRVATTIRVLVHETGNSKALLGQLNHNYRQLEILDVPPRKKEPQLSFGAEAVRRLHQAAGSSVPPAGGRPVR